MKKIGVVTAGGDAPGMNAAIRSVVRSAIYNGLKVVGFERGYAGLIEGQIRHMGPRSVSGIINLGGTILKTVRCREIKTPEGIEKAVEVLKTTGVDGLITIGGDGTFRGASELYKASGTPMIGIPATIDNDVAGTDTTIGFDTAVNTALSAIDKIRDTATSHERIFVVEVMGRKRGFLALEVGFAGGAEVILVPEIKFDADKICERLIRAREEGKTSEIIVMAEGVGNSRQVADWIAKRTGYEVRLTVLGYIQRGGVPTARSRALASEFGHHAVELLLSGEKKRMVGIRKGEITSIDLDRSWKEEKKLDLKRHKLAEILSQ
ncbi:6-phosphofructokinase [Candidatus Bathyarchaeota archaeon ex4484_231]|nr:MAG: 6-phosphofructokinase [Candidatus Bathyarchaeota archaeon ex4484_231]RJS76311.1 MAG: 6-phosphofructokinase [Candidatus Bathyarchaeota archaeon]